MPEQSSPPVESICNDVGNGSDGHSAFNRVCLVCQVEFHTSGRGRYCSSTCRVRAFRSRRNAVTVDNEGMTRILKSQDELVPRTVYECPGCEVRFLGNHRCPDCNLMCRKLGLGGCCPHCDEPVAVSDLLP